MGLDAVDQEGNAVLLERGGWLVFLVGMPMFYAILIGAAYLWTLKVEPACGRVVDWLTELAFERNGEILVKDEGKGWRQQALNGIGGATASES